MKKIFFLCVSFFCAFFQIFFLNVPISNSATFDVKVFSFPSYKQVLFFTKMPINIELHKNELVLNFEEHVDFDKDYLFKNLKLFVKSLNFEDDNKVFRITLNSYNYKHDVIQGEGFSGFDIISPEEESSDSNDQVKNQIEESTFSSLGSKGKSKNTNDIDPLLNEKIDKHLSSVKKPATNMAEGLDKELLGKEKLLESVAETKDNKLSFTFDKEVGSAVFVRGQVLWVVFDNKVDIDISKILLDHRKYLKSGYSLENRNYTILHFLIRKKNSNPLVSKFKNNLFIDFSDKELKNKQDIEVKFDRSNRLLSKLIIFINENTKPLRFIDSDIGDEIIVIPLKNVDSLVSKPYSYTDFVVLKTLQGVAIQLNTENVLLDNKQNQISLMGPTSFLGSSSLKNLKQNIDNKDENVLEEKEKQKDFVLLDFANWYRPESVDFVNTMNKMVKQFLDAESSNKGNALFDIVSFYFARGFYPEAISSIEMLKKYDKKIYSSLRTKMIEAASLFFLNKYGEALEVYRFIEKSNLITDYYVEEVNLWKNAAFIKMLNERELDKFISQNPLKERDNRKLQDIDITEHKKEQVEIKEAFHLLDHFEDIDIFSFKDIFEIEKGKLWWGDVNNYDFHLDIYSFLKNKDGFLSYYPPNIYNALGLVMLDKAIRDSSLGLSEQILLTLKKDDNDKLKNDIEYLKGLIYAKDEEYNLAISTWEPLTKDILDRVNRAKAILATAILEFKYNKSSLKDTINTLNNIKFIWRGNTFEFGLLRLLGYLYIQDHNYLKGLRIWKELVDNYPNSQHSFLIEKKMSEIFLKIFEKNKMTNMNQLEALTLYYEFQDLIPIGDRGDIIISNLIDRLIDINLLEKAAALLSHQVNFRFEGEKKEKAILKLINLYMRDDQPQKVLEILDKTKYQNMSEAMKNKRKYFRAEALIKDNKISKAVDLIKNDYSIKSSFLKADIYWKIKDWDHVIKELRRPLRDIQRNESTLSQEEANQLIHLAISYAIIGKKYHLNYLYNHFLPFIADKGQKDLLSFLSNEGHVKSSKSIEDTLSIDNLKNFLDGYLKLQNVSN